MFKFIMFQLNFTVGMSQFVYPKQSKVKDSLFENTENPIQREQPRDQNMPIESDILKSLLKHI